MTQERSAVVRGAVLGLVFVLHAVWAVSGAGVTEPAFGVAVDAVRRR